LFSVAIFINFRVYKNGQRISGIDSLGSLIDMIYTSEIPCLTDGDGNPINSMPKWNSEMNVLHTVSECTGPVSVGIGTNNPVARLDVRGGGYFFGKVGIATQNPVGMFQVTHPTHSQELYILTEDGKVGIGTFEPQAMLDVRGGGYFIGDLHVANDEEAELNTTFKASIDAGDKNGLLVKTNKEEAYGFNIKTVVNHELTKAISVVSANDETENFLVYGNGHVFARKFIVREDPFPDYVFEEDYSLMPLSELESYIAKNKHLPNMPNAEEVKEHGADVGEIQRISVEKIEELTLYIIELNKRIEKLEEENKKLKDNSSSK
jgi:hypothetical protein